MNSSSPKLKVCSLFSGIGGFELGIQRAIGKENLQVVFASEWDKYAAQIYDKNFNDTNKNREQESIGERTIGEHIRHTGDIPNSNVWRGKSKQKEGHRLLNGLYISKSKNYETKIDQRDIRTVPTNEIPDHDLLVGGFPCQAFSIAGKRKGFDDTRGTLFFEIARILREKKPRLFILENVKGLLSSHTTLTFEGIVDSLSKELSIKENICLNNFQPIREWETESDNLSVYLQSIGGTSGLQKNYQSLLEKTLPIIKKQNFYPSGKMQPSESNENEWASSLRRLSFTDNLNMADIPLLEKMVVINGDFVQSLKNKLEENSNQQKSSTTLTGTNLTTDLKTCISVLQELNIILFIIKQWKLSTNLWNKIKSPSKTGGMYYVKTFNIILSTLDELGYDLQWQVLNSKNFGVPQNRERVFIIGNLRGTSRPEVFPITENNSEDIVLPTVTTRVTADSNGTYVCKRQTYKALTERRTEEAKRLRRLGIVKDTRNLKKLEPREDGIANTVTTGDVKNSSLTNGSEIRRLTPTECERLQGFPEIEKYSIIEVCKRVNANGVESHLNIKVIDKDNVVLPNVLIDCVENGVEIHSQEKLLLNAKNAEKKNWYHPHIKIDDFVQMLVGINIIKEKIINFGEEELHQKEQSLTLQQNGKKQEKLYGKEIMQPVGSVENDLITLKELLKFTTLNHSDTENSEQKLQTLSLFVIRAINGYIPKEILNQDTFTVGIKTKVGYTYGVSDTQRYKCLGNAVTVNVVEYIVSKLIIQKRNKGL